ncbi:MAG: hypothetical protein IT349_19200 [Candidatus Eisenbacteria bacterium]|nr:hypothetical protein [Candidatus Eisenbacteria bacterium]
MTDTETPRTNEAERTAPWPLSGQQGAWKFARTLERELICAQAELEAITEAIGTRDGHSSVPHVIALKATIAEQAKEIERLTATVAAKDEAIKRLNGWLDNDRRALGEEG